MADIFDKEKRSRIMRSIGSKNTSTEVRLRKLVFSMGYRYRLHYTKLPGRPDIAFPSKKKVIFVHGCFWHQHQDCKRGTQPKTNTEYWLPKLAQNRERDEKKLSEIRNLGWQALVVWECELKVKNKEALGKKIVDFLD